MRTRIHFVPALPQWPSHLARAMPRNIKHGILVLAIANGLALTSLAQEPVSAVWDIPAGQPVELRVELLRDELLTVLARENVMHLSRDELRRRWDAVVDSYEQNLAPGLPGAPPAGRRLRTEVFNADFPMARFQQIFLQFAATFPTRLQLSPASEFRVQQQIAGNEYVGLGVQPGSQVGYLIFQRIVPGGPADRAGLKDGVEILSIDGWDTYGQPVNESIERIRGPRGTVVTLRIRQLGKEEDVAIRRDFVRFDSITDVPNRPVWEAKWIAPADTRVAQLKFTRFSSSTVHELRQIEARLRTSQCRLAILDLRQLQVVGEWQHAQLIADALIAGGVLWEERDRHGNATPIAADGDCLFRGYSMIVLISGHSPAPTLAVARALQNLRSATVIHDFNRFPTSSDDEESLPADATQPGEILGSPTEFFPLSGGRWMLSVPTRHWYAVPGKPGTVGVRYTRKQEMVPYPEEFVEINGLKRPIRMPVGVRRPVTTVDPPIKAIPSDLLPDADVLAMQLAKIALAEKESP